MLWGNAKVDKKSLLQVEFIKVLGSEFEPRKNGGSYDSFEEQRFYTY